MDALPWGEYALVAAWSGLKFFVGLAFALAFRFGWIEQFVTTGVGGVGGVLVFTYFGAGLRAWWRRLRRLDASTQPPPPAWVLRVWQRFGLAGVAVLTPFLMPALAAAVAIAFGTPPGRAARAMSLSMLLWALFFALLGDTPPVRSLIDWVGSLFH